MGDDEGTRLAGVNPSLAKVQGAFSIGSKTTLKKAYKRAYDFCLKYETRKKINPLVKEEGYYPPSRVRCLSQQFRWATDESNMVLCSGMDPNAIGRFLVKNILVPVLNRIPIPGIKNFLGPNIIITATNMIKKSGVKIFDRMMKDIGKYFPPFMGLPSTIVRFLYTFVNNQINAWTGFSFRNIFTHDHPRDLMSQQMGYTDFAIDKEQNRMTKVYSTDERADCQKATSFKKPSLSGIGAAERLKIAPYEDTGCPDAIPLREAQVTGGRAGDFSDSPLSSMQPGRVWIRMASEKVRVAYLKSSLCVKIPVCDTTLANWASGAIYNPAQASLDCSGHGQCVWNKRLGNHCKCDQGYDYNSTKQQCCKKGDRSCGKLSTKKSTVKAIQKIKKEAKTEIKAAQNEAKQATKQAKKVIKAAQKQAKSNDATSSASSSKPEMKKGFLFPDLYHLHHNNNNASLGETSGQKKKGERKGTRKGKWKAKQKTFEKKSFWRRYAEAVAPGNKKDGKTMFEIEGPKDVSLTCASKGAGECVEINGCQWDGGKCVDAAVWQCGVQKSIIDCVATKEMAPVSVSFLLDAYCGIHLLKQKKRKWRGCSHGIRRGEPCETSKDCPDYVFGPFNPAKTKGAAKAVCRTSKLAVQGCADATQKQCEAVGFQNFAAMAV